MQFLTASLLSLALIGSPLLAQQTPPGTSQQPVTPDQAQQSPAPPEQGMNMEFTHHMSMRHTHSGKGRHEVHHAGYHHHAMRCSCPPAHMRMRHHSTTHHVMKTKTTTSYEELKESRCVTGRARQPLFQPLDRIITGEKFVVTDQFLVKRDGRLHALDDEFLKRPTKAADTVSRFEP